MQARVCLALENFLYPMGYKYLPVFSCMSVCVFDLEDHSFSVVKYKHLSVFLSNTFITFFLSLALQSIWNLIFKMLCHKDIY